MEAMEAMKNAFNILLERGFLQIGQTTTCVEQ